MIKRRQRGFNLIELMIVVAIIGILATFAYPSYQEYIQKSRRSDAMGALTGLANAMERYFTQNGRYVDADGDPPTLGTGGIFPNKSPIDGSETFYNLTIDEDATDASTYRLVATPTGPQASDRCGTLAIDHTGAREADETDCWAR